ncbi:hypothetical protein OH76DRAFT_65976 [Lentinus brumalis]|uniref:Bola-like protein n=1 Tax=Lentinus brumalis TaxID=2498619 RepID=A0A371DKK1_9APHY|nr:hypothetical protein OH76DRAFT_65976 [Polyporus brumalis]
MFSLALARRIARPPLVGRPATAFARWYAASQANFATEGEKDVSGGCGTFYNITIASDEFKGLPLVKQQRLVNQTLKAEIEGIHGLQLKTMAPK